MNKYLKKIYDILKKSGIKKIDSIDLEEILSYINLISSTQILISDDFEFYIYEYFKDDKHICNLVDVQWLEYEPLENQSEKTLKFIFNLLSN